MFTYFFIRFQIPETNQKKIEFWVHSYFMHSHWKIRKQIYTYSALSYHTKSLKNEIKCLVQSHIRWARVGGWLVQCTPDRTERGGVEFNTFFALLAYFLRWLKNSIWGYSGGRAAVVKFFTLQCPSKSNPHLKCHFIFSKIIYLDISMVEKIWEKNQNIFRNAKEHAMFWDYYILSTK